MGKERARLDDFILLAEGTEALLFSSSLFMLSFQAAPELFINPKVLAEKNLPTSKSGKGEPETECAWEPLSSPQEVSSNEVSLSQSSSCFFPVWGEQISTRTEERSPQGPRWPYWGCGLEGTPPGQQLGASFCQPC